MISQLKRTRVDMFVTCHNSLQGAVVQLFVVRYQQRGAPHLHDCVIYFQTTPHGNCDSLLREVD